MVITIIYKFGYEKITNKKEEKLHVEDNCNINTLWKYLKQKYHRLNSYGIKTPIFIVNGKKVSNDTVFNEEDVVIMMSFLGGG